MSFKYGILCIALFIIVLFLANKSYVVLTHPWELIPDKGAAKKSEPKARSSAAGGVVKEPASRAPYILIAEKNIFSPERKDFQGTGPGSASKSAIRPEVILYGITIARNYQSASLVNPGRSLKKGERELMTLKLGERIGEYKLTKVLSDRITLEAHGDSFEVLLYDPKVPKKRDGGSPGAPSSVSAPTGTPRPSVRTEATKGAIGSAQQWTSPSQIPSPIPTPIPGPAPAPSQIPGGTPTPDQIPGLTPTPTQIPAPMVPTLIVPPFTPTLVAPPPEMGQPVPIPSGMGQPLPTPASTPTQPPSPRGK